MSAQTSSQNALKYAVLLSDALRPLENAEEIKSVASNMLGQYLAADRVLYFEVQEDNYLVERDYIRDVASLNGRHPVAFFGLAVFETLRSGRTAVEVDCWLNQDISSEIRSACDAVQIRAYVGVPLVKAGTFVGGLAVHQAQPRDWTCAEVALIEATAERTWAAVERARATRQLRASERLQRLALEAADLGVWSIDPVDTTLTTDERFRTIFQGTTDALSYDGAVSAVHPEDSARILDAIKSAMRLVDPMPYAQEYRVLWPDGSQHWVFATGRGHVVDGPKGPYLESFDGTIQDITERIKGEVVKADAEQRKDEFLAMLSHELRNPLVPIGNAVQLLRLHSNNDARQLQAVSIIERQVSQLQRMVDDLLEVSRITTGQLNLRLASTALDSIVNGAVETTQPLMAQRQHKLVLSMPSQPIWLDADAFRIEQVLVNLLRNAAQYCDDGCQITVAATQEGPELVLRVHDTGAGIDPALLPHIFDLFTQAKRSLARSEGGLGLGLALVKRLVELHGGRVEAFSTPGLGSEFVVRLPATMLQVPVHAPVSADAARNDGRKLANIKHRVLVVDDNIDAAESLADLLNLCGHEARVAHDGLSALAVASQWQPDVMLLDIGLPQMDGYDVARHIRAQPEMKHVVLIALTGYGQAADIRDAMAAGFDHHLTKPAEFNKIQEILEGS